MQQIKMHIIKKPSWFLVVFTKFTRRHRTKKHEATVPPYNKKGRPMVVPTILDFIVARRVARLLLSSKTRCYSFPLLSSANTFVGDFHKSIMPSSLRSLTIIAIIGNMNTPSTPNILRPKYIAIRVTKGGSPN